MGLIDVLPKKIEDKLDAIATDVQLKLHALDPAVRDVPALVSEAKGLLVELRAELDAIRQARMRLFNSPG